MEQVPSASETTGLSETAGQPQVSRQTLVRSPLPILGDEDPNEPVDPAEDRLGKRVVDQSLWVLLSSFLIPALTPFPLALVVRNACRTFGIPSQGVRAAIALVISVAAGICSLTFWLLWAFMRPSPAALPLGWVGLRRLPAVDVGFQRSQQDPFGFTPGSFHVPNSRRNATSPP